ncbi:DUF742 domain-containing protein [Nonomuraea terrae]|uniref:DUF742 domain-containing protein n=1 Tax=Nonomuraea terrae TaxID=2530383 RepID=A0A4R4YLC4_9ACTN|nr:DUF742 domain-containing protein [Nonomuraea terrae]TDD45808.1 DUF742 domain-containing protein [Nonomuraea terrae]
MSGHQPPGRDDPRAHPAPRQSSPQPGKRLIHQDNPDRFYTITGGRTRADEKAFDTVTLIVAECDPQPGQQSEHARILQLTRRPMSVVEISAQLRLPVTAIKILLCELLDRGHITARHPVSAPSSAPDLEVLEQVLNGLRNL